MIQIRRQLPVHSPLPLRAVIAGLEGLATGGEIARRSVADALADRFGPAEILLTDSGTTALTLALRAVALEWPSRPVALPAYSCYDVATAAVGAEAAVLLYDVVPETLSPDPGSLRETLERGVSAVVVAHLYGIPMDMEVAEDLTAQAGIPLIEDAAQAAGARHGGRLLGTIGDLVVLSFGRGKGVTGCGGGALLARGEPGRSWIRDVARTLPAGKTRGWGRLPLLMGQKVFGRPSLYGVPSSFPFLDLGETVYRDPSPPGVMSDLSAGVLSVTLPLDADGEHVSGRRAIASRWRSVVGQAEGLTAVMPLPGSEPGYLRFPVLATGEAAGRLRGAEARSLGVMPGYPEPLDRLPALAGLQRNPSAAHPGARTLAERLFTLPTHGLLEPADRRRIEDLVGGGVEDLAAEGRQAGQ